MTILGFFFSLDYKRQEGKEREGKDSIFTCQTIEIGLKNGMSKVSVLALRGCLNVFQDGGTLKSALSTSNPPPIKLFFDHQEAIQWSKSAKTEFYGPDMGIGFEKNAQHTRYSQPVTHVSTNPARPSLTSVIGRELVYSRRYDANRVTVDRNRLYIDMVLGKKRPNRAFGGFKGMKSRVDSKLNAPQS